MRPEQEAAVEKTMAYFESVYAESSGKTRSSFLREAALEKAEQTLASS